MMSALRNDLSTAALEDLCGWFHLNDDKFIKVPDPRALFQQGKRYRYEKTG